MGNGKPLPSEVAQDLRTTRVKIEAGYQSWCDMDVDLRELEIKLFPVLLNVSQGEVHTMLELLAKAMAGTLDERDLDLSPLKPLIPDCTIPKVCTR